VERTLLLTDIVGSTGLWDRVPDAMEAALARHDQLVAATVARYGGVLVKARGEGDSTFNVFDRAADAINAAAEVQLVLIAEPWPEGLRLDARIAVHAGDVRERDGDYFGPTPNRAARLRSLAYGRQVLVSSAAADAAAANLADALVLRRLGSFRLRGLAEPEDVHQLCHPDLPDGFGALVGAELPDTNLRAPLDSFVGRDLEVRAISKVLDDHRLVTLVGPGGVGKTRLAMEVGAERLPDTSGGVFIVELAGVAEDDRVASTAAAALEVLEGEGSPEAALAAWAAERAPMVIIDNCEHVLAGAARLAEKLAQASPGVRVLATSRTPLGVRGEQRIALAPMPVPPDGLAAMEGLLDFDVVRLFLERASEQIHDFAVEPADAALLAGICARLDGLPLAVELAAARVSSMGLADLHDRIAATMDVIASHDDARVDRHRTMRAVIQWSHDLLGDTARKVLRRLAYLPAGATIAAAEEVCSGGGVEASDVLDALSGLVARSLVVADVRGARTRYRMLETIRAFARDELTAANEEGAVVERLGTWLNAFAGAATVQAAERDPAAVNAIQTEHENVRAFLGAVVAGRDALAPAGLELMVSLWQPWAFAGLFSEALSWLEAMLDRTDDMSTLTCINAHVGAGNLAGQMRETARARAHFERALELADGLAEKNNAALAILSQLSYLAADDGDLEGALDFAQQTLEAAGDDPGDRLPGLHAMSAVLLNSGRYREAEAVLREILAFDPSAEVFVNAVPYLNLGMILMQRGEMREAHELLMKAASICRDYGDTFLLVPVLGMLATTEVDLGEPEAAEATIVEAASGSAGLPVSLQLAVWEAQVLLALDRGDLVAARAVADNAVAASAGYPDSEISAALLCGSVLIAAGDLVAATALVLPAVAKATGSGFESLQRQAELELALVSFRTGDDRRCEELISGALEWVIANEVRPWLHRALVLLAGVAARRGEIERAARLLGAAAGIADVLESSLVKRDAAELEVVINTVRDALGADGYDAGIAAGRAAGLDELLGAQ
jgi:predicted ATPase/class 3 adenylate cyclase/Tfp pilus assembly protein PilF